MVVGMVSLTTFLVDKDTMETIKGQFSYLEVSNISRAELELLHKWRRKVAIHEQHF